MIPGSPPTYDHRVKIIRLTDWNYGNPRLFTAPMLPGGFYNMTIYLYSGNTLVESQNINLTNVLGVNFAKADIDVKHPMDASTNEIFEIRAKLLSTVTSNIPIGYDTESAQTYSRIKFIFETKEGYDQDLGTGIKTG